MAGRNREVYRGKHRRRSIIGVVVAVVLLLILAAVVMFYSFQKYLVYGQDGVTLELPILATPTPVDENGESTGFAEIDVELVVDAADYSAVEATAGEGLGDLAALFVPAEDIVAGRLDQYVALLDDYGASALVLEVKPDSGQLVWPSSTAMAASFALSGSFDLPTALASLKEQGIYTVAQLSCCLDSLLATRNSPVALRNGFGTVYTDGVGCWLDPYNANVRQYISDLGAELADMGFDELLFKYIEQPVTDETLAYSETMSFTPTPKIGVSGMALTLTRNMDYYGIPVSALISYSSLANGYADKSGQDIELFFKVFDRVCCWAGTQFEHNLYKDSLSQYVVVGSADQRFVPIMSYAPDTTSWIVKVPDRLIDRGED